MFPHPHVRRERAEGSAPGSGFEAGLASASSRAGTGASDSAVASGRAIERLSLVEALVAELGAWTSAIVCRCHLPVGPFLASDGAVHLDLAVFRAETGERGEPLSALE